MDDDGVLGGAGAFYTNPIWGCSRGRGMGSGGIMSILFQKFQIIDYFPFNLGCPDHILVNFLH